MPVTEAPEIVFNHHDADYAANWQRKAAELHALDYPLAWTEAHGGYWVLGSWVDLKSSLEDWKSWSSDNDIADERDSYKGVTIPRQPYPLVLNESDPPFHTALRMLEVPFFTPQMLRTWTAEAQGYLDERIEAALPLERIDLVRDLIIPTTARTTLRVVGWDMDDWEDAAYSAHEWGYISPGQPGFPAEGMARLQRRFVEMLAERRVSPSEDVVNALSKGQVMGRPLTDGEAESMISALVFGGFDTTTAAALHALIWLDRHRDLHPRLIEDDAFLTNAVEEFLRIFSPASGVARNATRDLELGGHRIRKGQQVYFWLSGANRDPRKFPEPDNIWLERPNARDHVAFSAGSHRCLGASLAKLELKLIIKTVLERLPDYSIDHEGIVPFPSFKSVNGLSVVPMKVHSPANG